MTALKAIVLALGVVLVAGFSLLLLRWAERPPGPGGVPALSEPAPGGPLTDATVPLPAGARVVQVAPAGPLVDVLVARPDGTWDLMQVRRADGAVAGTLRLTPVPGPPAAP